VCGIIAVLTLAARVHGTNSVLRLAEHQARTAACVAALGALQSDLFGETVREGAHREGAAFARHHQAHYDEYFPLGRRWRS